MSHSIKDDEFQQPQLEFTSSTVSQDLRIQGSHNTLAPYSEKGSPRVFLAMHRPPHSTKRSIAMIDPDFFWERKAGIESLTLFSDVEGSVRRRSLIRISDDKTALSAHARAKAASKKKPATRNMLREKTLQTKNIVARSLIKSYGEDCVDIRNSHLNYVHAINPIVVSVGEDVLFINFKTSGRPRSPAGAVEFEGSNPHHSQVDFDLVDTSDGKSVVITTTFDLAEGKSYIQQKLTALVKQALCKPLESCRKYFSDVILGEADTEAARKARQVKANTVQAGSKANTTAPVEPDAEAEAIKSVDVGNLEGSLDLSALTSEQIELIRQVASKLGMKESPKGKSRGRLSNDEYKALKDREKLELWESSDLYAQFVGTPLLEIAEIKNQWFNYDPKNKDGNHDRGILANATHWHAIAIRALFDLNFVNGDHIDIDEVCDYIDEEFLALDPSRDHLRVGDNRPTRFMSVLAFYNDNARALGLNTSYRPTTVNVMKRGKSVSDGQLHYAVSFSMGDEDKIMKLIALGNYNHETKS